MSAALNIPNSPSSSRPSVTPVSSVVKSHPIPLREQAFALHCQGLRSPAISAQLGVPQRTIRAWIAADLKILAEEQRATRREQLALAVERQHTLTAAAWSEFEAEIAARHTLLDALLLALTSAGTSPESATANAPIPRLPASTPAPRYLTLILQADKEIARLLGLYTLAKLDLLTPEPDTDISGASTAPASSESPAESATAIPAISATESPLSAHGAGSARNVACSKEKGGQGPEVRFPFPAESATVSDFLHPVGDPLDAVGALPAAPTRGKDQSPAETATAVTGLAAGIGTPANPHPPLSPAPSALISYIPAESATGSLAPVASAVHATPLSPQVVGALPAAPSVPGPRSLRLRATGKPRTDRAPRRLRR